MCCEADWKREIVQDHKWDFVNVREFHRTDFFTRLKYIWRYILLLKSIAVYGLDIFTATTLILSNHWTNVIQSKCDDNCVIEVKFVIAKWIFVGCIIFSFLLLGYETYKAKKVIETRDISYSFTNLLANDYYSFKNYDNFCLFCHIDNSTKKKDDFAFFIYFTFKDWKRLLLADGPRQSINALLLYSFAAANGFQTSNIPAYWDNSPITAMLLFSMIATVLIFAGSLILLVVAAVLYVPLLCYIQGNLKEYVCHKVDKRIGEIIKRKQRDRMRKAAALEKKLAGDGLRNSKGELIKGNILQPTLPDVKLHEEDYAGRARRKAEKAGMNVPFESPGDAYGGYPPTLDYQPQPHAPGGFYQQEEYGSSTGLAASAAPMGLSYPPPTAAPLPPQSYGQTTYLPPSRSQTSLSAYRPPHRSITPPPPNSYGGYAPQQTSYAPGPSYAPYSQNSYAAPALAPSSAYPLPRSGPSQLSIPQVEGYRHYGETVLSPGGMSSHSGYSQPSYYGASGSGGGGRRTPPTQDPGRRESGGGLAYYEEVDREVSRTAPPEYTPGGYSSASRVGWDKR